LRTSNHSQHQIEVQRLPPLQFAGEFRNFQVIIKP
jgi:hypothetical protein